MKVKRYGTGLNGRIEEMECGAFTGYEDYAALLKERDALAVENASMLRLLTDISENHGEFVNDADDYMYASVPLDYVSEINMYVSRDVNAENPFVATDAAIANIQAQGVDKYAEMFKLMADMNIKHNQEFITLTEWYAKQLRNEAIHD